MNRPNSYRLIYPKDYLDVVSVISRLRRMLIEETLLRKIEICGSTMDLTKAFNLIPRKPAELILLRLGFPSEVLSFWMHNLSHLSRSLQFAGVQGPCVESTCGFPEGDSLSILAMIAVSVVSYYSVTTDQLKAFAFADNWAWVSTSLEHQFNAWVATLNLVSS